MMMIKIGPSPGTKNKKITMSPNKTIATTGKRERGTETSPKRKTKNTVKAFFYGKKIKV
jgi:hypothetical protein